MSKRPQPTLDLDTVFGPLELKVLDALWAREGAVVVRDLMEAELEGVAYTTIMTTLDRLYRKGVLTRERSGRAYAYLPVQSRDQVSSGLASSALAALMPRDPGSIRALLSTFVDEVNRRDASLLDELAEEVRRRQEDQEEDVP
jgi:predicted transcriptional regulator